MKNRFFHVEYYNKWKHTDFDFSYAKNHIEAIRQYTDKKIVRVFNPRYREIEQTGEYFRVTEEKLSNGKALIFEVIN